MKAFNRYSLEQKKIRWRPASVSIVGLLMVFASHLSFADEEALAQRLRKLERALDNQGLLEMYQRLEALQSEVQTLRGQIEEQQYTIERLRQSQQDAYVDLDRRLQETLQFGANGDANMAVPNANPPLTVYQPGMQPEVAGTPAPGIDVQVQQSPNLSTPAANNVLPTPQSKVQSDNATAVDNGGVQTLDPNQSTNATPAARNENLGPSAPAPEGTNTDGVLATSEGLASPQSPDEAYRQAFGLLKAGKYPESIEAFNLFLLDYPNSEYADNSQYWLGETYFVQQDYTSAIEQYQKLITNYPQSKKQSHALLKIGYSFQRLGELDKARAVLSELQTRYPGSTAARLAAERLQQIAASTP